MKRVRCLNTAPLALILPLVAVLAVAACTEEEAGSPDGGVSTDGGTNVVACPGALLEQPQTCTAESCTATEGLKTFGQATLPAEKAEDWIVPVWAASEIDTAGTTLEYAKTAAGGLTAGGAVVTRQRSAALTADRARAFYGDETFELIYGRADRILAESAIRAQQSRTFVDVRATSGTAIRARSLAPSGVLRQAASCTKAAPTTCGESALCVTPEGAETGTCGSQLTLKFQTSATEFDEIPSTVRKVGRFGAIVVDDAASAALSTADSDELLERFDDHIAVLDHAFFGTPEDRDGNGVVLLFVTGRVADAGANVAGFFRSDDLKPTSAAPTSNSAELLYLRTPGGNVTLDQLSGTIGHEYQHLINYYAKNAAGESSGEDVWLDEGLATFAEDMLGYGSDAFKNDAAYLGAVDQTSLTGDGICPDGATSDSTCRRGMAHLLVRYYFEQKGGATFGSAAGQVTDKGGVAAVKALVQSTDTGTLLFAQATTGRTFDAWLGDLLTTVAVDGAGFTGVSCNPKYTLAAPETAGYTNYQRGIDLRTAFTTSEGQRVTLTGPNTATLETESIPIGANAGEIRTVRVTSGNVNISVGGGVDYLVGFHAIPAVK